MVPAPGYSNAAAAAPGLSNVPTDALTAANATVDPIASLNASQNFTSVDPAYAQIGSEAATAAQVADAATIANRAADFGTSAEIAAAANTAPKSFADAIKAREDEQRLINEAQAYANDVIPKARGAAARKMQEAEGYKEQVLAQAQGETSRFSQLLTQNSKAPAWHAWQKSMDANAHALRSIQRDTLASLKRSEKTQRQRHIWRSFHKPLARGEQQACISEIFDPASRIRYDSSTLWTTELECIRDPATIKSLQLDFLFSMRIY
jgi:hypothetical protein